MLLFFFLYYKYICCRSKCGARADVGVPVPFTDAHAEEVRPAHDFQRHHQGRNIKKDEVACVSGIDY